VGRREDVSILVVFSAQLVTIFTLLALVLFHTPLRDTILRGLIGLTPELASYAEPALAISFAMAAFWGCTALQRRARQGAHDGITCGQRPIAHRDRRRQQLDRSYQSGHQRRHAPYGRVDPLLCSRDGRKHMASAEAGMVRGEANANLLLGVWQLGRGGGAMRSNYTHSEIDVRRANLSELGSFVSGSEGSPDGGAISY
jgi:hypothetical protein